jgi:hypothetical protein
VVVSSSRAIASEERQMSRGGGDLTTGVETECSAMTLVLSSLDLPPHSTAFTWRCNKSAAYHEAESCTPSTDTKELRNEAVFDLLLRTPSGYLRITCSRTRAHAGRHASS